MAQIVSTTQHASIEGELQRRRTALGEQPSGKPHARSPLEYLAARGHYIMVQRGQSKRANGLAQGRVGRWKVT